MVKRHKIMDQILFISLGLIMLFAWADAENVFGLRQISDPNVWDIWFAQMLPAIFNVWMGALLAIALVWYLVSKDKSEALALFVTPATLIIFGVQDLFQYAFSTDLFNESIGCWADALTPVRLISDFFGETCPTTFSFTISAVMGIILATILYVKLKEAKW